MDPKGEGADGSPMMFSQGEDPQRVKDDARVLGFRGFRALGGLGSKMRFLAKSRTFSGG